MIKEEWMLTDTNKKQAVRALDLLTIVLRGLQETGCPAMALVCATQDALILASMSLLAAAHRIDETQTYTDAVQYLEEMQRDLHQAIERYVQRMAGDPRQRDSTIGQVH